MTSHSYLRSLCQIIEDIIKENPAATIWLGGDINLPNIDWSTNSISGNNYPISFCNLVLDLFYDVDLTQFVTFPTRIGNTLDIFATNKPSLLDKCIPIPGISDHKSIYVESCIKARCRQPTRGKIFLWAKADFLYISQSLNKSVAAFLDKYTLSSSVHQMWSDFTDMYAECLDLVPQKLSSIRFNQPWVTSKTKRICRKSPQFWVN